MFSYNYAKSRWSVFVDPSFFCSVGNQDLTKYLFRNPRENETFLRNALSRNFDHKEKNLCQLFFVGHTDFHCKLDPNILLSCSDQISYLKIEGRKKLIICKKWITFNSASLKWFRNALGRVGWKKWRTNICNFSCKFRGHANCARHAASLQGLITNQTLFNIQHNSKKVPASSATQCGETLYEEASKFY